MGLLSKRRKVPRIVKKTKSRVGRKHISVKQLDPRIREHWDQNMTVSENFKAIGIKLDLNPNLKTTKEGRHSLSLAHKMFLKDLPPAPEAKAVDEAEEQEN